MSAASKQSKGKRKAKTSEQTPSSNWLALQKKNKDASKATSKAPPKKRRGIDNLTNDRISETGSSTRENESTSSFPRGRGSRPLHSSTDAEIDLPVWKHGRESLEYLRKMILGQLDYSEEQKDPGKYLALDCEMVGVGPRGSESSLARVSLVNYHGAIILDEFVRQRERVVDYRTFVSGVRAENMVGATPFVDVQKRVADLLKDRILVGHAVHNDLKALLLSQPRTLLRDTQLCAGKAKLLKTKYPALRRLVQQELGVTIQAGEHSSVTDARATMALYRLHKKEWDKFFRHVPDISGSVKSLGKRKSSTKFEAIEGDELEATLSSATSIKPSRGRKEAQVTTWGGKRGISTGLSTIIKRGERRIKMGKVTSGPERSGGGTKGWWSTLGAAASASQAGKR